uniref:Uncharacterized protein n=1 Tax=Manihot esculenta TaxID=3983 RepID=A0A2C9UBR2_MANES
MANDQENDLLLKAGMEGFSSLEQRQSRKTAAGSGRGRPARNNYELAPTINSKEAARRYGGILIEPVITSHEAALRYGGTVIVPAMTSVQVVERLGGVLITDGRKGQVSGA